MTVLSSLLNISSTLQCIPRRNKCLWLGWLITVLRSVGSLSWTTYFCACLQLPLPSNTKTAGQIWKTGVTHVTPKSIRRNDPVHQRNDICQRSWLPSKLTTILVGMTVFLTTSCYRLSLLILVWRIQQTRGPLDEVRNIRHQYRTLLRRCYNFHVEYLSWVLTRNDWMQYTLKVPKTLPLNRY